MSTLLYVDDEVVISSAVARWFARRGHTVHLAISVATAKQAIEDHEPDALFAALERSLAETERRSEA